MKPDAVSFSLLQDGTIGDDLVVKPISAEVRRLLAQKSYRDQIAAEESSLIEDFLRAKIATANEESEHLKELHDDYAFLDEDEDLEDEDVMVREKCRILCIALFHNLVPVLFPKEPFKPF